MREYGSEHPAVILPDGYLESFSQFGNITWLRSGREGLFFVAQGIKGKKNPIILFPAYCCWSGRRRRQPGLVPIRRQWRYGRAC